MTNFASRNKVPLTILIIILWAVFSFIDYKIEGKSSTMIQWILFFVTIIILVFTHFIAAADEIEYQEEQYPIQNCGFPLPGGPEDESEITKEDIMTIVHDYAIEEHYKTHPKENVLEGWKPNGDGTMSKTVFVMQPINITQDEFNEKINPQINMERKSVKELKPATEKLVAIITYKANNIPQRFKAMYGDICNFATSGEPKTEDEITKKIMGYGRPFKTDRPQDGLVAFEIENGIRLPEAGYFGVK